MKIVNSKLGNMLIEDALNRKQAAWYDSFINKKTLPKGPGTPKPKSPKSTKTSPSQKGKFDLSDSFKIRAQQVFMNIAKMKTSIDATLKECFEFTNAMKETIGFNEEAKKIFGHNLIAPETLNSFANFVKSLQGWKVDLTQAQEKIKTEGQLSFVEQQPYIDEQNMVKTLQERGYTINPPASVDQEKSPAPMTEQTPTQIMGK